MKASPRVHADEQKEEETNKLGKSLAQNYVSQVWKIQPIIIWKGNNRMLYGMARANARATMNRQRRKFLFFFLRFFFEDSIFHKFLERNHIFSLRQCNAITRFLCVRWIRGMSFWVEFPCAMIVIGTKKWDMMEDVDVRDGEKEKRMNL